MRSSQGTIGYQPSAAMQTHPLSARPSEPRGASKASHTKPAAIAITLAAALLAGASLPAVALDGCQVLLCLAAPNWRAIPQCVPPITQLWRDLARGKSFPRCNMSGGANSASHAWAQAPSYCPPQYTRAVEGPNGTFYTCDYAGAVSVTVNGQAFARTWWTFDGDTVTEFSPAAKAMLGTWDTRFDVEFAAWLASRPPAQPRESGY